MSHYLSNLRDVTFNLFEVFGIDRVLGTGPYHELDPDTVRSVLAEVDRMAREDIAASYVISDRTPPVFDPVRHTVSVPEPLRRSYQAFMDSEFWRLGLPPELGGTPAPRMLWWSIAELVLGANPAVWMYSSGPAFAQVLYREGTAEQRRWAQLAVDKGWGATMVLTEPDAGSDVGAGRTRAIPQPAGPDHLAGGKRFIT